jgi:hypothetical protein
MLYGSETFAADAAAVAQRGASPPGPLAGQKAVLPFPANLGRLILTFHKFCPIGAREDNIEP